MRPKACLMPLPWSLSKRVRHFVQLNRDLLDLMVRHGVPIQARIDEPMGYARCTLWFSVQNGAHSRDFTARAGDLVQRMEAHEARMTQKQRCEAHGYVYRDILRPPFSGQIGFEDSEEDWWA